MPNTVKFIHGKFRVVEKKTGKPTRNHKGTPVDGGGFQTKRQALAQAVAINISQHHKKMLAQYFMNSTIQITQDEVRVACKSSYATFCRLMQDDGWFDPVHEDICNQIQTEYERCLVLGIDCKIAIIMPRGSLKSTVVTKYFPVWRAINDPNVRVLIATNTVPNARKKLRDIRSVFESHHVFRSLFPELLPTTKCRWTDEGAEINRPQAFPEATFENSGMKTKKIGTHYTDILEDDTVAPQDSDMKTDITVPSTEDIEQAIGWHQSATGLLVPKGTRVRLIVSTRWSDFDLIQHVTEKESYKVINVPAVDDSGVSNFPSIYPVEKLEEIKLQYGPYMYSCLYLNRPIDASQRKFHPDWIKQAWITPDEVPEQGYITISIDPAISEKDEACETAITVVQHYVDQGLHPFQYWLSAIHGHYDIFKQVQILLDLAENQKLPVKALVIETVAYQLALKQVLLDEMVKREVKFDIVQSDSRSKKAIRIEAMVPYFASGRIKILKGISKQVESQLTQFPHGRLVDVIDSFAMHLPRSKREKALKPVATKDIVDSNDFIQVLNSIKKRKQGEPGQLPTGLESQKFADLDDVLDTNLETSGVTLLSASRF